MNRWLGLLICIVLGLGMVLCGLLVPAHLRAVDASVLQFAGRGTPSLADRGLELERDRNTDGAVFVLQVAEERQIPGWQRLDATIAADHPDTSRKAGYAAPGAATPAAEDRVSLQPVSDFMIQRASRERTLKLLESSPSPAVAELLRFRNATNTQVFPPARSASGQALEATLAMTGLLLDGGFLTANLSNRIAAAAASANSGSDTVPLEELLMDFLSLGQRMNGSQLNLFVARVEDPATLRSLAQAARVSARQVPLLFSAVVLSGNPAAVAHYLDAFSQTGMVELGEGVAAGSGGLEELLRRNQRVSRSALPPLGLEVSFRTPMLALGFKWFLYLAGGFLLATAIHFARPKTPALERPLQVQGFHVAREILFALGFLLALVFVSEPFLAQDDQRAQIPLRLHLPMAGGAAPAGPAPTQTHIMNEPILLTLLLFFVLQGLLYTACVLKLAEIRRQRVPARTKLKLLENEDHLFDAGLYLGFVGTIISLILVSMGVIKFSLMAAYSSTSFGIIFVSVFKIFHLRPARRTLLLEAESTPQDSPASSTPAAPQAIAIHL
ncbi:MAG: hypothetical protein U1F98_12435 [Verrucomicrobiota bacterium]